MTGALLLAAIINVSATNPRCLDAGSAWVERVLL